MIKNTNMFILENLGLPIITDIYTFSEQIGLSPSLIYILSNNSSRYYKEHFVIKKDGTQRVIYEPSYSFKLVQKWILEEILYKIPVSSYSFGFKKALSNPLKSNASMHKDNLYILELDFKNFFPSISRDTVYYIFNEIGYNSTMSNLFANLCTLHQKLPQGAVTSPCLSNLACRHLDKRISKYCSKRGIVYTRYADDLTFSSNDKALLQSIYAIIKKIIEDEGFYLNSNKTRLLTPKGKKAVTGVTISNGELKAPKEMKRKVRAMIHKAIVSGDYSSAQQIKGYISYINSIEDGFLPKIKKYIQSFAEKPICLYIDLVNAFNSHKFFNDLDDFLLLKNSSFVNLQDESLFESCNESERYDYLSSHDLINKDKTEKTPPLSRLTDDDDNLPF